ncbi:MAG: hypothetical protein ACYTAN_18800 [Planctomycetota bacterium]
MKLDELGDKLVEATRTMRDVTLGLEDVGDKAKPLPAIFGKFSGQAREAKPVLEDLEKATEDLSGEIDGYGESLQGATGLSRTLIQENARLVQSFRETSAAVNQLRGDFAKMSAERRSRGSEGTAPNVLGGRSTFATIGPGQFTNWGAGRVVQDFDGRLRVVN